jgi:acyl-coenzyme A thioesterase PaaI-like protein
VGVRVELLRLRGGNHDGLRIPFFHDREDDEIVAGFELDEWFSGAPSYVHGGVVLAVLDEAMAWATIAIGGLFAVTKETTTRFRRPVRVGAAYEVRAWLTGHGDELRCEAEVVDGEGERCAVAAATFVPLGAAEAVDAIGTEVTGTDARYLRAEG